MHSGEEFLEKAVRGKTGAYSNMTMVDAFSDSILLEFALMIGVIHISLGLLTLSYGAIGRGSAGCASWSGPTFISL